MEVRNKPESTEFGPRMYDWDVYEAKYSPASVFKYFRSRITSRPYQYNHPGDTWMKRAVRAMSTAQRNFGCDFRDNQCVAQREFLAPISPKYTYLQQQFAYNGQFGGGSVQGCCASCRNQLGYLDEIAPGTLMTYFRLWTKDFGFWGVGGCKLPRELRSDTCLNYRCESATANLIQINKLNKEQPV